MKKFLWIVLICALGCSRRSAPEIASIAPLAATAAAPRAAEPPPPPQGAADSAPSSAGALANMSADGGFDRQVIRNATLQLIAQGPVETTERATQLAVDAGGFLLDGHVESSSGTPNSSKVVLRVPGSAFEKTLTAIHDLGAMREETITGQDVTDEMVDSESRVRALRTLQARLLALLERTAGLGDLLQVEQELARVGGEIERYEGRLRYLRERTDMATIELTVFAPEAPAPLVAYQEETIGSRFKHAFRKSTHLCVDVIETGIVLLGFMLPTSAFAGLFLAPVVWFRRRRRLHAQAGGEAA